MRVESLTRLAAVVSNVPIVAVDAVDAVIRVVSRLQPAIRNRASNAQTSAQF
jgi:hypothetical protein